MKRIIPALLLTSVVLLLFSACAAAISWRKIGTGPVPTDPGKMQDYAKIVVNSIAVDSEGNVYATTNDGNHGYVVIIELDGTMHTIDLDAKGLAGGVTKLVLAGDGKIYGLQNWLEISSSTARGVNRILRFQPTGEVESIWCPDQGGGCIILDSNRIGGMTVGADGNVYWTTNSSTYWRTKFLWRYDTSAGVAALCSSTADNGWGETHRLFDLEHTCIAEQGDWFAVFKSGTSSWRVDAIGAAPLDRRITVNGTNNPATGRDWITATAYDPENKVLYAGGRGTSYKCIISRWAGTPTNNCIFTTTNASGQLEGIAVNTAIFADGEGDVEAGEWWITTMAWNPADGKLWYAYAGQAAFADPKRGHILTLDAAMNLSDEGLIEEGADVVAIGFGPHGEYATVYNRTTREYSIYTTAPPLPTVTINQAADQPDPALTGPINFTVVFSEPVTGFGDSPSDVMIGGTAGASSFIVTGDGTTYNVAVSGMTSPGTVTASIPAGAAVSAASGMPNLASTSSDNIVTFSPPAPSVLVEQDAGQIDPTDRSPIAFSVVFSEPVTGFGEEDIVLSGSAGPTTAQVSGDGQVFSVLVSGMSSSGTVSMTIPAGSAVSASYGIPNLDSTSTDNTVTFVLGDIRISGLKMLPDQSPAYLGRRTVTAVFDQEFYVEEEDRSSGIMVRPEVMPVGIAVGKKVIAAGEVRTWPGSRERYISGQVAVSDETGSIGPLLMPNHAVVGGDWFYDPGTGAGQQGIPGYNGLNTVGLLVKTWGLVVDRFYEPPQEAWFDIEAGDPIMIPPYYIVEMARIRVACGNIAPPELGRAVTVIGVASCIEIDGKWHPLLKIRVPDDVQSAEQ